MMSRLLNDGGRTYVLVFNRGDEVVDGLFAFAAENDIGAAHFTGIGALSEATLAFFDLDRNEYDEIPVDEQVEVLALVGNLARFEGGPKVHAHVVLGHRDGSAVGGHLLRGVANPTLEVFITALPDTIKREEDAVTGLPLLAL